MSTNTETVTTGAPAEAPPKGKPQLSEGARAERRLGFMLIAPAVIVMIAVTAYPVVYAIYLSLERYNLALPQAKKFIGFANYGAVLSSPYWWHALYVTVDHHGLLGGHHAGARLPAGLRPAPDDIQPGPGPHHLAHPVRDRDGGRRLQLAVRVDARSGLPVLDIQQQCAADQSVPGHRRHHHRRDLEDHAVHGAAAAGRPVAGAGRPAEGRAGGRRHGAGSASRRSRCR